ncbi:hypothetical protein [Fischerella sp. JS2]|nr:hypothetical protein [Fischerella sp. JS2]
MTSQLSQNPNTWELNVRLSRKRESDPGLSWYDKNEAPSIDLTFLDVAT